MGPAAQVLDGLTVLPLDGVFEQVDRCLPAVMSATAQRVPVETTNPLSWKVNASSGRARVLSPAGRLGFGAMADNEADVNSPSGSASPDPGVSAWRMAGRLSEAECMELLANGGVGRLVFTSRYGLTALPVVYRIDGESIVLGTWDPAVFDEDLRTGIAHADYQVAMEADQIDPEARAGWFVLAQGAAHHLDTEAERAPFIDAGLEPWIEGMSAHFIRVTPTHFFGLRGRRA